MIPINAYQMRYAPQLDRLPPTAFGFEMVMAVEAGVGRAEEEEEEDRVAVAVIAAAAAVEENALP